MHYRQRAPNFNVASTERKPLHEAVLASAAPAGSMQPKQAPDITAKNGWARATVAGQDGAAAYFTIVNRGGGDDRLVEVSVPRAGMAMLHNSSMDGGVMRMRDLSDGLVIPAGATLRLAPNGTHVMLSGLSRPLVTGDEFPATLRFDKAGSKILMIKVVEPSAR